MPDVPHPLMCAAAEQGVELSSADVAELEAIGGGAVLAGIWAWVQAHGADAVKLLPQVIAAVRAGDWQTVLVLVLSVLATK